jgi:hypothetical protein
VRFVVSLPEIATPVPPVQPRMTKAQQEEMEGWFLKEIWRGITGRLKSWRTGSTSGTGNHPATSPPVAHLPPRNTADLVAEEAFGEVASAKKRWGEERDSWFNPGYAPYFGAQWIGVFPGPGPDDLPAVHMRLDGNKERAREAPVPC